MIRPGYEPKRSDPSARSPLVVFVPTRGCQGLQRKDPGGSEPSRSLLSASTGFGRRRDRKSGLPSQPRCHRTPWPRGELERLLTKLKGGADRPQIGMGQAEMRRPQPLPAFRKGGRSSGLLPRRCSPGPGGTPNRTGAWEGVSWPISHGDNPSTGRSPRLRRGASHTGPRCTWGSGPAAPQF